MISYLFLYGTLLRGEKANEVKDIIKTFRRIGRASVRGRLYDLGPYPGAVLDSPSGFSVHGELVKVPHDPAMLERLDEYEEFDPSNLRSSVFIRQKTRVNLDDGRKVMAWIYVYNRDPGAAPLIQSGDYSKTKVA